MIGQHKLLHTVDKMVDNGFPRFTIICGLQSSGKKLVAKYISNKLMAQFIPCDTKVDSIRQVISLAYKQSMPTVYLVADADKMSPAAKNALLKITEEPPRKAYFIMTLTDINNTLSTLKSRGMVFNIDPYTPTDIQDYIHYKQYVLDKEETNIVTNLCTVPGEVDLLMTYNIKDFYNYVRLVIDNIGKVSGANAFKIGQKLKYKDEDSGWNITLFMRALMYNYLNILDTNKDRCYNSIKVVSKYLAQLNTTGINKSATIDMMILELRGIWVED